jgi:hypothetical protein
MDLGLPTKGKKSVKENDFIDFATKKKSLIAVHNCSKTRAKPTESNNKQCILVYKIHAYIWKVPIINAWITGFGILEFCLTSFLSCILKIHRTNFCDR